MSRKQKDAAVAQSVVRRIGSAEVAGPIPVSSFFIYKNKSRELSGETRQLFWQKGNRMNYRLILQYDGSRYDGWQRQGNTEKTVQGKIEEVLSRLLEEPVEIDGAGRTDAGVHALGQTANFHTERKLDPEELKAALNQFLPEDIGVLRAEEVPERFHSRLNARGKTYRYRVATGEEKNVFERKQIYPLDQPLDVDAMRRGAALMIGEKDFRGFSSMKKTKKSTVRRLESIEIREVSGEVRLEFTGNGFLYNMVRILTGTLLEIGMGKREPESVETIFREKDRNLAGFTAPARGLTLVEVFYQKNS